MVLFKLVLNSSKIYNVIHLHSTMVLFKLILCPVGRYSALIFTFHYGPIQIGQSFFFARIYFTKFTFHYGPIQIEFCNTYKYLELRFTFHYGPIQIKLFEPQISYISKIYIPLWSYSNTKKKTSSHVRTYLHSTMVLFKLITTRSYFFVIIIYIPLWSYSNNLRMAIANPLT